MGSFRGTGARCGRWEPPSISRMPSSIWPPLTGGFDMTRPETFANRLAAVLARGHEMASRLLPILIARIRAVLQRSSAGSPDLDEGALIAGSVPTQCC